MGKQVFWVGLVVAASGLSGCVEESAPESAALEVQFRQIHEGVHAESGIMTDKQTVVLTTQERYGEALAVYSTDAPQAIDFNSSRVLLADMGARNTGGYSVSVTSVEAFDDHVRANIQLVKPGPGCIVTQALTNPYQFVLIDTDKEVLVSESVVVTPCDQGASK